jgi:VWFA-related protein
MYIGKMYLAVSTVLLAAAAIPLLARQNAATPGVPASVVVTLEPRRGKTIPAIDQTDLKVTEAGQTRQITGFQSLANAPTQMLIMIDDSARSSFDTLIPQLKQFVTGLPATTQVAVGYMGNGITRLTANFTSDHAAAAASIRVVEGVGGADVSPYDSLKDVISKWPTDGAPRREVVMISSGIEGLGGGFTEDNPYVDAGISAAQKAGIVVYGIYNPSVGHSGHSYWRNTWGQNFLAELCDRTGGESYNLLLGSVVDLAPFLDQIREAQQQQYVLTFLAKPENKSGLQSLRVSVNNKDASVAHPDRVYIKASL